VGVGGFVGSVEASGVEVSGGSGVNVSVGIRVGVEVSASVGAGGEALGSRVARMKGALYGEVGVAEGVVVAQEIRKIQTTREAMRARRERVYECTCLPVYISSQYEF